VSEKLFENIPDADPELAEALKHYRDEYARRHGRTPSVPQAAKPGKCDFCGSTNRANHSVECLAYWHNTPAPAPQAAQCPKYMILEKALRNLMAVIFRDGGQKAASFRNDAEAAQAAESAVVALLAKGRESTQHATDQKGKLIDPNSPTTRKPPYAEIDRMLTERFGWPWEPRIQTLYAAICDLFDRPTPTPADSQLSDARECQTCKRESIGCGNTCGNCRDAYEKRSAPSPEEAKERDALRAELSKANQALEVEHERYLDCHRDWKLERAENERLRDALREALNHWQMYAEQDPDFESTTDPTPESIEYRKCRAALFPKHCDLCDKMMESLEDRTQWHGLGNCVETCSHCNGSGVEPAPDQKGKL
jgi:hypothetical protein